MPGFECWNTTHEIEVDRRRETFSGAVWQRLGSASSRSSPHTPMCSGRTAAPGTVRFTYRCSSISRQSRHASLCDRHRSPQPSFPLIRSDRGPLGALRSLPPVCLTRSLSPSVCLTRSPPRQEWKAYAERVDHLEGHDEWRKRPDSLLYNHKVHAVHLPFKKGTFREIRVVPLNPPPPSRAPFPSKHQGFLVVGAPMSWTKPISLRRDDI